MLTDLKRAYTEAKLKITDVIKTNSELKAKIIQGDNTLRLQSEDFKQIVKKHSNLQKQFENKEKERSQIFNDLCYKEERLKALRYMNSKLEQKSKEILDKWTEISEFQGKANELKDENKQMIHVIEKLRTEIGDVKEDKERLNEVVENL